MINLPIELQRRIYELDPTYRMVMNNIIKYDLPNYRLKKHRLYPYLLELFDDINYDFDNAMYYYTDATGEAQVSYIDDNLNDITDNFIPDGDKITYQGNDITYLLEGYMTPSFDDSDFNNSDEEYFSD
jgi:hypothetical protein